MMRKIALSAMLLSFGSMAGTSAEQLPSNDDLTGAIDEKHAAYSRFSSDDGSDDGSVGSYIIAADFKKKNGFCYAENNKLKTTLILGGGEGQAKFHCGDEWILSGNDSQNYTLSAYTTLSKVLQLHQSNFGIDLFNTQAKLRHSHTQLIANSSYLPKDDSFIIYTADVGFYGSAYVDITTMAHEAGHKDTAFLLRNEDGSLFYEALKEGIADLYAVTLHNLYRAENGENTISWLIVLNQTDQRSSRALRSLNNPSNDYPASGNKHASEESKDKTPYQNAGDLRFLFYKMANRTFNYDPQASKSSQILELYKTFKAASVQLGKNSSRQDYLSALQTSLSSSPLSNIDYTDDFKSVGWL